MYQSRIIHIQTGAILRKEPLIRSTEQIAQIHYVIVSD